jgi:hypothetical protein
VESLSSPLLTDVRSVIRENGRFMTFQALALRLSRANHGSDLEDVSSALVRLVRNGGIPSLKLPSDKNGRRKCFTFLLGGKCGRVLLFSDKEAAREEIARIYTDMQTRIAREAREDERRNLRRIASNIQRYLASQLDGIGT